MSLQRASVNCERCYALAQQIIEKLDFDKERARMEILKNNDIYRARDEAMKDVEEFDYPDSPVVSRSLTSCMQCDYSAPKMSDIIKQFQEE